MILDSKEKFLRTVQRLKGIESGRPMIGPETLHFRLTDLCNLSCQYCWDYGPNNTERPSGRNHFPLEVFHNVIRDCIELRVDRIELSGIGDPTFHPHFYEMLGCLENSFTTTIFTNATFHIDRCRDILKADHIIINLGAADRSSYIALQGRDLFIRVIKNIKELARLRAKINPNFRLEVVFIETKMNMGSFADTEKLVMKLGVDNIRKSPFEVSDHNQHLLLSDQRQTLGLVNKWVPCYHGWFDSAIRLNGEVNVCAFTQQLTIGNVFKRSFRDIWNSQEYATARNLAFKGEKPFGCLHECMNCRAVRRNTFIKGQLESFKERRKQ